MPIDPIAVNGGIKNPSDTFTSIENGKETTGVIAESEGRLWFVPLDSRLGHTETEDTVYATGPAREVVGFGAFEMEEYHADSFDAFREKVKAEAVLGDFRVEPTTSITSTDGPIRIISASEIEAARHAEIDAGRDRIDLTLLTEKMNLVVSRSSEFIDAAASNDHIEDIQNWNGAVERWSKAISDRNGKGGAEAERIVMNRVDALFDEVKPQMNGTPAYASLIEATDDVRRYSTERPQFRIPTESGLHPNDLRDASDIMIALREAAAFPIAFTREEQDRFERTVIARTLAENDDTVSQTEAVFSALAKHGHVPYGNRTDGGVDAGEAIWNVLEGEIDPIGTARIDAVARSSKSLISQLSDMAGTDAPAGSPVHDLMRAIYTREHDRDSHSDAAVLLGAERLLQNLNDISRMGMPEHAVLETRLQRAGRQLEIARKTAETKGIDNSSEAGLYAALTMGRLRAMGMLPIGHDQGRQDEFETKSLAPLFLGATVRSDGYRMELAEEAARQMDTRGLLNQGALANVPVTIQSILAMPLGEVRECLDVPSHRSHDGPGDSTIPQVGNVGGIFSQAADLNGGQKSIAAKGRRPVDGVEAIMTVRDGGRDR